MLFETLATARDLGRLNEIVSILIKFGFGDMVRRVGLAKALESAGRILHWTEATQLSNMEPPQRIRCALEELGPTFVKLGQVLSTRVDLFPPDYIKEFEKLQDNANALPFENIRTQLEEDLLAPWEKVFSSLNTNPLAAASIAQVYRAKLNTGDEVVLKIRRPGIRTIIEADLRLLTRLANMAEEQIDELKLFRPNEIVKEFSRSIRRELDLAEECRNAERVSTNFADDPNILVPEVYAEWTCERLNVQQFIDGIPGRDLKAVDAAGLDRNLLAHRGADAFMKMIFEDGIFHADPHPGNIFYLPGERIVFVDFGMVGYLSAERRDQLLDLVHGLIERRADRVVKVLSSWATDGEIEDKSLLVEIDAFIEQVHGIPLKSLNVSKITNDLIAMMRTHELVVPSDLTMLNKALFSLEGMGRHLDPEFNPMTRAEPFLKKALLARYSPEALAKRGYSAATDAYDLATGLPQDAWDLIKTMRRGKFKFRMEIDQTEYFLDRLDRSITRVTMGIVIAALIVGSSIVMTVAGGEIPFGLSVFAMLGFSAAVVGGSWLLFSMWRDR